MPKSMGLEEGANGLVVKDITQSIGPGNQAPLAHLAGAVIEV